MAPAQAKMPGGKVMKWKEQDYPTVYANLMGFGMTPFDIALVFGEVGDSSLTEVIGIPKVKILLAPEQAANLHKLLGAAIDAYVKGNGPLRMSGGVNIAEINSQLEAQKSSTPQ